MLLCPHVYALLVLDNEPGLGRNTIEFERMMVLVLKGVRSVDPVVEQCIIGYILVSSALSFLADSGMTPTHQSKTC